MVGWQGKTTLVQCLFVCLLSNALKKRCAKAVECFPFSTELFDNYMQQDAHEFLNYLLNTIADLLQEERKQEKTNGRLANGTLDSQNNNSNATPAPTWVHEIFQGTLTNETRCLTCETVRLAWLGVKVARFTKHTHTHLLSSDKQQRRGLSGPFCGCGTEYLHHTLSQVTTCPATQARCTETQFRRV